MFPFVPSVHSLGILLLGVLWGLFSLRLLSLIPIPPRILALRTYSRAYRLAWIPLVPTLLAGVLGNLDRLLHILSSRRCYLTYMRYPSSSLIVLIDL